VNHRIQVEHTVSEEVNKNIFNEFRIKETHKKKKKKKKKNPQKISSPKDLNQRRGVDMENMNMNGVSAGADWKSPRLAVECAKPVRSDQNNTIRGRACCVLYSYVAECNPNPSSLADE
jgi:hypothetical protein